MEGGNKAELNLDAGLDVNTSDMLVSVNNNTWQHNWQKYQGKFLPNSVRFEKNGWAAGWNVYDFKYENLRLNLGENLWVSNTQLNDLPSYMLCYYDSELSADLQGSFVYTIESKVLSISNNTSAIFDVSDDSVLHCSFNGLDCDVLFDKSTQQLTVSNNNVRIGYNKQSDGVYEIILTDINSTDINCSFTKGSFLSCEQFITDCKYDGFDGVHSWDDGLYIFNGTDIIVNDDNGTLDNLTVNITDNVVTFSYDLLYNLSLSLNIDFYEYVKAFNDLTVSGTYYDNIPVLSSELNPMLSINRILCDISDTDLVLNDHGVSLDFSVPVWLTVHVDFDIDKSQGACLPNNVEEDSIQFVGISPHTAFVAKSIFDDSVRTGLVDNFRSVHTISYIGLPEVHVSVDHRFNAIALKNDIQWVHPNKQYYSTIRNETIFLDKAGNYASIYTRNIPAGRIYQGSPEYSKYENDHLLFNHGTGGESDTPYVQFKFDHKEFSIEYRLAFWTGLISDSNNPISDTSRVKYTCNSFEYNPTSLFEYNDVFQYNPSAHIERVLPSFPIPDAIIINYPIEVLSQNINVQDISSIKLKNTDDSSSLIVPYDNNSYFTSEATYALSLVYDEIGNTLGVTELQNNATLHEYDENDTYYTASEIYNSLLQIQEDSVSNGTVTVPAYGRNGYLLNSYKTIEKHTRIDENYYPFDKVPCFNYKGSNATGDTGVMETGVYAVYRKQVGNTTVTVVVKDFEEFRQLVLGRYDEHPAQYPVTAVNDADRKRKVLCFPEPFYDYDFLTDASQAVKDHWKKMWPIWYPGVPDPIENPPTFENVTRDETYLNYNNIEVIEQRAANYKEAQQDSSITSYIKFFDPGVIIYNGSAGMYSLTCLNELDIVPWRDLCSSGNGNNTNVNAFILPFTIPSVKANFYHNHQDVSDKYDLSNVQTNTASINLKYIEHRNLDPGLIGGYYVDIEHNVVTINFASLKVLNDTLSLNSNVLSNIITYNGSNYGAKVIISGGGLSFNCAANDVSCWMSSITVTNNEINAFNYKQGLVNEVIRAYNAYINNADGFIITSVLKGHACLTVKYNDVYSAQDLNNFSYTPGENIAYGDIEPFTILKTPDAALSENRIYVDRSTLGNCSYAWINTIISGITVNDIVTRSNGNIVQGSISSIKVSFVKVDDSLKLYGALLDSESLSYSFYYPEVGDLSGGNTIKITDPDQIQVYIRASSDVLKVPVHAYFTADNIDINHRFFKEGFVDIFNKSYSNVSAFSLVDSNGIITIPITIGETTINFIYDTATCLLTCNTGSSILYGAELDFSSVTADFTFNNAVDDVNTHIVRNIDISTILHFLNITGNFTKVLSQDYVLLAYDAKADTIGIQYTTTMQSFDYSCRLNTIIGQDSFVVLKNIDGVYNVQFLLGNTQKINAIFNHLDNYDLTVTYRGNQYTVDIQQFFSNQNDILSIEATDIRQNKSKIIHNINASKEFQLIKQQWNSTIDVENYWWVDSKHILELRQDSLTLKKNTLELDDWNGNVWTDVFTILRTDIIETDAVYYTVLNRYGSTDPSLFVTINLVNGQLKCTVYDILNKFTVLGTVNITIRNVTLGQNLNTYTHSTNTVYLNTYSEITNAQVLTQAKWTNTYISQKVIIGCHMSNNFDQWAFVLDVSEGITCDSCIQGYGYVGLKGDLTGGQIPLEFFDVSLGFNTKVLPLSSLSKTRATDENADAPYIIKKNEEYKINEVEQRVVGTAEKQWYICKKITGVVSHLTFDVAQGFSVNVLPITSTFDAVYKSPSFRSEILYDNKIFSKALGEILNSSIGTSGVWSTFINAALNPKIWLYAPKLASINYLQQTIGQYAYVHYNSARYTELKEDENRLNTLADELNGKTAGAKEPLLSDEITFDKQILTQTSIIPYNEVKQNLLFLFHVFLPAIKALDSKFAVNESINMNTVSEVADVFTQSVTENLAGVMAKTLRTDSPTSGLSSTVVGVRSLDMFYSTSDNQRVFAGPGFVEHQFVADCVAQSVTDVSVSCYVEQLSFIIKILSLWQIKFTNLLTNAVIEGLQKAADYTAELTVTALGSGTNAAGIAAGIAALAGVKAAQLAARAADIAQDELEAMINNLADKMKADMTDSAVRSKMDTEGKHKYGEKSETFMWPCFGTPNSCLDYTDETVVACIKETPWALDLTSSKIFKNLEGVRIVTDASAAANKIDHSSFNADTVSSVAKTLKGDVPLYVASCYGSSTQRKLPNDMAKIEGVSSFLPMQAFKNENISVSEPAFTPSLFHDFVIDKTWQLSLCATYGLIQWVSCKDTKLINCAPSNMIVNDVFCGIAAPYTAIEIKRGLSKDYMRPWAVTPNVLAFNSTGYNTVLDNRVYHSFDGLSYRIVDWVGSVGINKNNQTFLYCFQINDRFKRSNKFPANEVQGNFTSDPTIDVNTIDRVFTLVTNAAKQKGLEGGTIGEDKDVTRWAIPIFTETVNTMPAAVKTLTAMQLNVFDGITALTTNIMNNQTAYKAPVSVDFTIGKNTYRYTNDYICLVQTKEGIDVVTEITPALGLTFIGASLTEAYFYSQATRFFYVFTGSVLMKMDMLERFRNIKLGAWDFINHEVIMPCLMTYTRLDSNVKDTDTETDNVIVPVMSKDKVSGELPPPLTTIFNDRSWYKTVSLPVGLAYQGPNRVIINRSVFAEYMLKSLKDNLGKWSHLDKEHYDTKRDYHDTYERINKDVQSINGWTYNPFVLVTSPLGLNEDTDCLFEWTITFCWPVEMDLIYGVDNYAVVNIMSETMTPGGKVIARPTHVYLTKELFTRSGNYGYYSFTYQSKNGAGNRERLHIWSDQYIAISSIICESKVVTSRRTEILTQQVDVKDLIEL